MTDKFYTIEEKETGRSWQQYDDYADAERYARERAYSEGRDYYVMAPVAIAKAPEQVNNVKVEQIT